MKVISTLRDLFLWLAIPFQKLLQKLSRPEPEMTREQVDFLLSKITYGDLLLSYEGGRLTSPFIKGVWDHLAGVNNVCKVIEAVAPKVRSQDLEEWLFKKKGVAVLRYGNESGEHDIIRTEASIFMNSFIDRLYDYLFKYKNSNVYCSELGFLSYYEYDKNFMKHIQAGREILPQDFYDAAQKGLSNLRIVAEVRN